jgi:hypothetical protein
MPTATTDKPACTHREVTPVRRCQSCGCYLRSFGNNDYCDPCITPEQELDEAEVLRRIAAMSDIRQRRRAFEAYAELQERAAA